MGIAVFTALEIDPDTTHAPLAEFEKVAVGDIGRHDSNAARGVAKFRQRIQHAAIVGAVE
jgi:hypothetical protein